MTASGNRDVFINAPFDTRYQEMLRAIVFAVVRSGFRVRCALEIDDSAQNRLNKICEIISQCKFAIHDISSTDTATKPPLARLNMALELGLFLGAKTFAGRAHQLKQCIIFDRTKFRYKDFISDLSGVDIHAHGGKPKDAVLETTAWLRNIAKGAVPGGGLHIWKEYLSFKSTMKKTCKIINMELSELTFSDYHRQVSDHVATL